MFRNISIDELILAVLLPVSVCFFLPTQTRADEGFKSTPPGFKTTTEINPRKDLRIIDPPPIAKPAIESQLPESPPSETTSAVVPARKAIEIVEPVGGPEFELEPMPSAYAVRIHISGHCPPCGWMQRHYPAGTYGDIDLVYTFDAAPLVWDQRGYMREPILPFTEWNDRNGKLTYIEGRTTIEEILARIKRNEPPELGSSKPIPVGAMPAIRDGGMIATGLDQVAKWLGRDVKISIDWTRRNAKAQLLATDHHSLEDVIGTDSTFVIEVSSVEKGYRFRHEMTCNPMTFKPTDNKVGCPILIIWSIVSMAWDVYDLMHPQVSLFLPETIHINAMMVAGTAVIDFGPHPPNVQILWKFWLGLLKVENNRPLTGLRISPDSIKVEFHRSRIYREFTLPVQGSPKQKSAPPEPLRTSETERRPVARITRVRSVDA